MAAPRLATPSPLWFHLLAGPNGAGKSTLYRALVREGILGPPLEFVNADLHERAHLQHMTDPQQRSEAARAWAEARRTALMDARTSFASETVFSHPSKLRLIDAAQRLGYTVALHIVALDDPARLPARVAQRVREGGHPVPVDRILAPQEIPDFAGATNKGRFLAKRFAAKEAFSKALGTGVRPPATLSAIAILHDHLGKPVLGFSPALHALLEEKNLKAHLSISDEAEYAVAYVILEQA